MVTSPIVRMRWILAFAALVSGCASRSQLDRASREDGGEVGALNDSGREDAEAVDVAGETWSREAGGEACSTRAVSCLIGHDFGPSKSVADVFTACSAKTGTACGDLLMAFDAEGCLAEVREIREYSAAFVECVAAEASATRWECASGKSLRMLQACP